MTVLFLESTVVNSAPRLPSRGSGATVARRGLHPAGSIFQVVVGRSAEESVLHHIHIVDG